MDTFFYFISLFVFALGVVNLSLLIIFHRRTYDRGAWTLILPLAPLTLVTFLLILEYYLLYRYVGRSYPVIILSLEWLRVLIALSWNFIAFYHYALNGADRMRWGVVKALVGFSAVLCFLLPVVIFALPSWMPLIHIIVVIMFYFAGVKAVFILGKGRKLLPSTKAALSVAIISLVVYPAIGVGDPLGLRLPFLDPQMSLWVQAHPLYFALVNIPYTLFLVQVLRNYRNTGSTPGELRLLAESSLTARERDVLDLLYQGYRYSEIAEKLFVSLATVKTHVLHIYQKLDIGRREDLFIRYGRDN